MGKTSFYIDVNPLLKLFVRKFEPTNKNGEVIHLLHGMSEHSGRYADFANYLSTKGYTVYAHDHRHHGQSVKNKDKLGIFSKTETFEDVVEDVNIVQSHIANSEQTDSIITLGHSMGSVILRRFLQRDAPYVSQAIIMGTLPRYSSLYSLTMIGLAKVSGWGKSEKAPNKMIAKAINKSANKPFAKGRTDNDWLSSDESSVEAFNNDPLSNFVYNKYFYPAFFSCIHTINKPKNIAKTKKVPILFISGIEDTLSGQMKKIDRLNADYHRYNNALNTTLISIRDARHEVLNEVNKKETYEKIINWIQA